MSLDGTRYPVWFIALTTEDKECLLLARVVATHTAWLMMILGNLPTLASIVIGIASPLLFGGAIWHLRRTHWRSAINQIAFIGSIAFFLLYAPLLPLR